MTSSEDPPYRGEEMDGSYASLSPGISPRFSHSYRHDPSLRFLIRTTVALAAVGIAGIAAGIALHGAEGRAAFVGWVAAMVGGGLAVLLSLLFAFFADGYWGLSSGAFRNGLLTAGVVISQKPTTIAVLADMGSGGDATYYGVARIVVRDLPLLDNQVGTRVPCVATFRAEEGTEDRWGWFAPRPICLGTPRREDIDECFRRLGDEPFRQVESCASRGLVPDTEDQILLMDEGFRVICRLDRPK
jgi:hypothetical protein